MIGAYKMVLINSIISIILLTAILFYKHIFPKKNINFLILLILVSLLPIISIFRTGSYESGDFTIHLYRTIEFYNSLKEGHLMPSWAGGLNATYGYPLFIFNYPLPYYIISFFHWIGFSFILSMKLFLASNFVLSGIFMYLFSKKLFKNSLAAFTTAIFYQFTPYHLIDLHFKIVIGEILTFTILPFMFLSFQKLWEQRNRLWLSFSALSVALLIMSHVVLALFSILLLFCYAVFLSYKEKKKTLWTSTLLPIILGTISSSYIWLTPFFMMKHTITKDYNFVYFPQLWELLFSPWKMGFLYQGHKGEISFLLGYTHTFMFVILVFYLLRNSLLKKHKASTIYWLIAFIVIIFLISPYSKFLWGLFPFLKITGSHRLLLLTSFITSILAGYLAVHLIKKRFLLSLLIVLTVFSTILNWGHRRVIPEIGDQQIIANVPMSTAQGEGHFYANSKYRNQNSPWFTKQPKHHAELIKGSGEIQELNRTSTHHTYIISAKNQLLVRKNTLYFPGWHVYANNKELRINPDKEGIITFTLPKGLHYIEVKYTDLVIYQILKTISFMGFTGLIMYLLFKLLKK